MPLFSLVIPTLRRADTLEHALATLLDQPERDVEIVIQNNGNDPETRAVVETCGDPRLKHLATDEVLSMTENWELALANTTGELITFVGDDDGLLPDACTVAASIFDQTDAELLSWEPGLYLWPTYWDEHRRNRLQVHVSPKFEVRSEPTQLLLERFYAFRSHYSKLPMLYNSFVRRSIVDRVVERHGKYFFGSLPDVSSGIVNATFSETFLKSTRPLSIAGLSGNSLGQRLSRADTRQSTKDVARDFPGLVAEADTNVERLIAVEMALLEEEVVRRHRGVSLDERRLPWAMAAAINESPSRYEETKSSIVALMTRFGIEPDELPIPPPLDPPPAPATGVHVRGDSDALFVIDGDLLGLASIADAVRLASQLMPGTEAIVLAPATQTLPELSSAPLSFGSDGPGRQALVSGWSEPEGWGTWSVERECVLHFDVPGPGRLGLRYRMLPSPSGRPRVVSCGHQRWEIDDYEGELLIESPPERRGRVELRLVNEDRYSAHDLNGSDDTRPLGIGVIQIRLVA
jgi:hypothetical protein